MEKEWLFLYIVMLLSFLVVIVCIVHIVRWYKSDAKKAKSGEIDTSMRPFRYYSEHPEKFSVAHTYAIMKGPMGQNIQKKDRQRLFAILCLFGLSIIATYFSPQWSKWVEKLLPFTATSAFVFISGVVWMVGMFVIYLKYSVNEDKKVWVCPYCKMPLMRVKLSTKDSYAYQCDPKAIFIRHRWGGRNLLLVADQCPYCKKSFMNSDNAALHEENEH